VTHDIQEAVYLGRRILVLGTNGQGTHAIIDNSDAGDSDYRARPEFQRVTQDVRDRIRTAGGTALV
jgi:ABC-type nitrate/sulfonate/bicarbonate transport system ATPase subunit